MKRNILKSKWSTHATLANEVTGKGDYCLGSYMEIEEITTLQAKLNCCWYIWESLPELSRILSTNVESTTI